MYLIMETVLKCCVYEISVTILAHHHINNFYTNLFSGSKDNTYDCQTAKLKGMFVLLFTGNMPIAAGRKKKPSDEWVLSVSRLTEQ